MNPSPSPDSTPPMGAAGLAALALRVLQEGRQAYALLEGAHPSHARIIHLNTAFERMTGFVSAGSRGRTLRDLLCPIPEPREWAWSRGSATSAAHVYAALPCRRREGTLFSADLHIYPLGGDAPTGYWAAQISDITDQIQLHETIWQNENAQNLVSENIRDLITVWGRDGRCLFASQSSLQILGLPVSQVVGRSLTDFLHPDELFAMTTAFASHFSTSRQNQYVHRLKRNDGQFVWVESVTKTRVLDGTERPMDIVVTTRDISKRRAAEDGLKQVHALLSSIYDAVPIGLCIVDSHGVIAQSNRAFAELFRLPVHSAGGHPTHEYLPDHEFARAASTPGVPVECECIDGDGRPFPAEVSVIPLEDNASRLVVLTDVRDRRRIQEQLQDARRLESLGTLAGGIAHDFNNMLAIILGYASMLRDAAGDPARLGHYADTIMDAGRRGAEVVRQLQLFANTQEADTVPTDLHALLDDVIEQTSLDWPEAIRIERQFEAKESTVVVDPLQFAHALEKLLDNARNAMPQGGTLSVRTSEIRQSTFTPGAPAAESKVFLRITIQDSGRGMDAATRARMFDPFFARHKGAEARGLGLAVVYGIIRSHRGVIEVESTVGQGTSVHLLMPRASVPESLPSSESGAPLPGRRTILLVEDEQDLGALWNEILPSRGWRVVWARDGEEAVRLFRAHRDDIALVFTDIGLPLLDGWQVAASIRAEDSEIPLLITSGAFGNGDRQRDIAAPVHYLPKPYMHTKVLSEIERMTQRV